MLVILSEAKDLAETRVTRSRKVLRFAQDDNWPVFCKYVSSFTTTGERGAIMATTSWQAGTLVQCVSTRPWLKYPGGDDESGGCHDLTLGKIYEMLGVEGRGSFYRIIDDSGEDFLYPISHFKVV